MSTVTTHQLTALNRKNGDVFIRYASFPYSADMGGTDWLVWLFHNEARMIGREWQRAWERQQAQRLTGSGA